MMIKDIALSLVVWLLSVSPAFLQVFNYRNIILFQCAGCLRDVLIICNMASPQELFRDDFHVLVF